VQVIELFTNLDFFGATHCEQCVQRRLQKTVSRRQSERIGLPATLRFQVLQASGFRCHYCGRGSNSTPPVELEVDHIVPVAAGGTNDLGNLQAACRDCNRGKSATEIL
jgi:5-methylcytosine-specific restriction endonuclease McrA